MVGVSGLSVTRDRNTVTIRIDVEGATYIADVMADQWLHKKDYGAKDITEALEEVLP